MPVDEFEDIARLYRPLTFGAPEALGLLDDAAVIASRPGYDLVVTKDAVVAGVHFLPDDPLDLVARKLLRVNLSDLAAKAAEPYAYFLAVAWPQRCGPKARALFAAGLHQDQLAYGLTLLGGDTVSTPGPMSASVTMLGWVKTGETVKRSTALPGDAILVSGAIGDGGLGLRAATGELAGLSRAHCDFLAGRYRLPDPHPVLAGVLAAHASASADVSDGLLADAGHIGEASGTGVVIDLDWVPLSAAAAAWLALQPDPVEARLTLSSLGDDYQVVCTAPPSATDALIGQAASVGVVMTVVGRMTEATGLVALYDGVPVTVMRTGWRHG